MALEPELRRADLRRAARRLLAHDPSRLWARLEAPTFTSDPLTVGAGDGVYAAAEWSRTRQAAAEAAGATGSPLQDGLDFFRHCLRNADKLNAASALAEIIDFSRVRSVIDIGAGEAFQGAALVALHPHLRYTATDYDPWVVERCSRFSTLAGLEFTVLDARAITAADLEGHDLVLSWAFEYALNDPELEELLRAVAEADTTYVMCSVTCLGLVGLGIQRVRSRSLAASLEAGRIRAHGVARSMGRLRSLGRSQGLRSRYLGRRGAYDLVQFCR